MSGAFRRISPAVLVGTAAVLVVGAADNGFATLVGGDESSSNSAGAAVSPRTSSNSQGSASNLNDATEPLGSTGGSSDTTASSSTCDVTETTGPVVSTEWGPVQVAAKVSNGRVCAVRTLITPDGDRKSVSINARAVPQLEEAVLAVGTASFDAVSGATVTSEGYRESLQAILDQS